MVDDGIPGHQLMEVAGLARGAAAAGIAAPTYEELVRAQAVLDIGQPARDTPGQERGAVSRSLSFVTPLRTEGGEHVLVARSFALPGTADGGRAMAATPTLAVVAPDGVIPFAHVTWPGMIGVVTGVNAEGLAVLVHPARAADVRAQRVGQPVALLARDVLENAHNLNEAIAVLEHAEPLGAAAFLLVDGRARRWAVVERSPTRASVLRDPAPLVVTEQLSGRAFVEDPEIDRARRSTSTVSRAARTRELLRSHPPVDALAVAALLRDRSQSNGAVLPLGHEGTLLDLGAVHTALIDPAQMVIWVAEGPATARFRAFDLRHLLRGEGTRAAPPPDLPADSSLDSAQVDGVLEAQHLLISARHALTRGAVVQASEAIARALVRAPDLPAALRLAGDCARARGDHEGAAQFYRRYMTAPDNPGIAEQIKAYLSN
jgi:hypothetical protein